jgi:predicted nucleic acid-binding protein
MTEFADTFALIAWLNPADESHSAVTAFLDTFTGRLVTTEWVLMEVADALSAPPARMTVVAFLNAVRADPLFDIIGYEESLYRAGFELFAARADKFWSLTDCITFSPMSQRALLDALTADHHFHQAGFRAVFK